MNEPGSSASQKFYATAVDLEISIGNSAARSRLFEPCEVQLGLMLSTFENNTSSTTVDLDIKSLDAAFGIAHITLLEQLVNSMNSLMEKVRTH